MPYSSNADWVDALAQQQGYAQLQPWRPWRLRTVPAGYVTIYAAAAHTLTFLTVKESGHMVPQYQPERAFVHEGGHSGGSVKHKLSKAYF